MTLSSGTYRLGQLGTVELAQSASAEVKVTCGTTTVLEETLFADADGYVRISALNELLKPFCKSNEDTTFNLYIGNATYSIVVQYHCLTDGNNVTAQDSVQDASREGSMSALRTFTFTNADGVVETLNVWGVEIENPEIEITKGTIKNIEQVVDAHYIVRHEIQTDRLSGKEIKALTRLFASENIKVGGNRIVIATDEDLARWNNNPVGDRTAKFVWTLANITSSREEYKNVNVNENENENENENDNDNDNALREFVFVGQDNASHTIKLWGIEQETREFEGVETMVDGVSDMVDVRYRIAHQLTTGRMSRNKLRMLAVLVTSKSVTLGGKPVVFDAPDLSISSDPNSERTAQLTWRYADVRMRTSAHE